MTQTIPVLKPITAPVTPFTAWELIPEKVKRMEQWEKDRAEWAANVERLFPGWNAPCWYIKSVEVEARKYIQENPPPPQPFCKHCSQDFHPNEPRWCSNKECSWYLL